MGSSNVCIVPFIYTTITVYGPSKAFKLAKEDVISSMPDDVMTKILNCLPLQEAVRTCILSPNWKHKWTMLTQLVFDEDFYEYLKERKKEKDYGRIINMFFDCLKGAITKFDLYIEGGWNSIFNVEDFEKWVLVLSKKGIRKFTLINMDNRQVKLTNHLFSCLNLKHLELYNCLICPMEGFRGFPDLSSLDLSEVEFGSHRCGEFIAHCPLLEILELRSNYPSEIKQVEIAKLENLELLTLPLRELDNMEMITSSRIFELIDCFSKLQELNLNFWICKLLADVEVSVPTTLPCVKTLRLYEIDFSNEIMVSCVIDLICACSNLETLLIKVTYEDDVPAPAVSSSQLDFSRIRAMQLLKLVFVSVRGSENKVCLMKSLLDCSPLLEKMDISGESLELLGGTHGALIFATKLLKLRRASRVAEIEVDFR